MAFSRKFFTQTFTGGKYFALVLFFPSSINFFNIFEFIFKVDLYIFLQKFPRWRNTILKIININRNILKLLFKNQLFLLFPNNLCRLLFANLNTRVEIFRIENDIKAKY